MNISPYFIPEDSPDDITVPDEIFLKEPNLLVPGRLPVGHVTIDRASPMGAAADVVILPRVLWETNRTIGENRISAVYRTGISYEEGVTANSSRVYTVFSNATFRGWDIKLKAYDELTIFCIIKRAENTTNKYYFLDAGGAPPALDLSTSNAFHIELGTGSWSSYIKASGGSVQKNVATAFAASWVGGTNMVDIYQDGVAVPTTYDAVNGTLTTAIPDGATGHFLGNGSSWISADTSVYLVEIFNRKLTSDELLSLFYDPLQFLIPA